MEKAEATPAQSWDAPNPSHVVAAVKLVDPITLQGQPIPERPWRVDGWVPDLQVTMLNGDGGIGKTMLAQQLLTAAATGTQWIGLDVKPAKAMGFFCEDDDDELTIRQSKINESMGLDWADLENLAWQSRVGEDNALADFDRETWALRESDFYRSVLRTAMDYGAQLVVLDSLHDFYTANENDRSLARSFIGMLRRIAIAIDGAVLVTCHPSRAGRSDGSGESGSTAWSNAVRSRLYFRNPNDDDDPDARELTSMKVNYGPRGRCVPLKWEAGVFVPPFAPTGAVAAMERRNCETIFLELLDRLAAEGRPVSAKLRASNYAPKAMAKVPKGDRQGFVKKDFERAMESLFADKMINVGTYKDQSRHDREGIFRSAPGEAE